MVVVAHGLNQGLCVWCVRCTYGGSSPRLKPGVMWVVCGVWCVGCTYGGSSPRLKPGVMWVVCGV